MIKTNKTGRLLLCMAALATWLLGACDDTMGGATNTSPGFPTDTVFHVVYPDTTIEVTFCVGDDWKLSSNRSWCTTNGSENTSGERGEHTIPFTVSDESQRFVDEQAKITLWMNNESRVIAVITRRAKGYFMEISSEDEVYATGESIVLGTSGNMILNVNANFTPLIKSPKWLKVTRNEEILTLNVVEDSIKYVINNPEDSLVLTNSDATFSQTFHVQYAGMDSRALHISPQMEGTLSVSNDGRQCHIGTTEYNSPIAFKIVSLEDSYKLLSVDYDESEGCSLMTDEERWFEVIDDQCGNISLSFGQVNSGDDRMAYLFSLPQAIVDSLDNCAEGYEAAAINFLWEEVDGKAQLKENAQMFRIADMTQEKGKGWDITISPETRWNLRISTDGTIYSDAIRGDTCIAPVKALVTAQSGYELICASYNSQTGYLVMDVEDSWLEITDNKTDSVEIRFKANDENERIIYLFALPAPLVESLSTTSSEYHDKLSNILFGEVEGTLALKEKYEQYLIAKFTQEADEANSMKVLQQGYADMYVTKETNQTWLDMATAKGVAADKVFRCSLESGYAYQINPLIPPSIELSEVEIYGESGKKYEKNPADKEETPAYEEEHTKMEDTQGDYMLVQLSRIKIKEDFIIYFIDNDGKYLKALVVDFEE